MLFRCLHPMELDNGPWTRTSSIMCSLLLFATFFVLGVSRQAEIVGLGNHTLLEDGKVNLNMDKDYTYTGVKNIDYTGYKKFNGACNVTIKDDLIELQYNGELCTVELLSNLKDTIKLKAGVRDSGGIDTCLKKEAYYNLLPFIYSKNNDVIKNFSTGGPTPKNTCKYKEKCESREGACLDWTSLEVSWKRDGAYYFAYTHLIREAKDGLDVQEKVEGKKKEKMIFDLEIQQDNLTMSNVQSKYILYPSKEAVCAQEIKTIVEPKAWTINNTLLKDEYLLVFSLLPPSVSKIYEGSKFVNRTIPQKPNCTLFIQFSTEHYRLLTAIPTPTCTNIDNTPDYNDYHN